jgi:hypothetical protein
VLHELCKVEKLAEEVRGHILGLDCVLDVCDQFLLETG